MTINEEQELRILKIFNDNKIERFSKFELPAALTNALGSGADTIVRNLMRDGMITDWAVFPTTDYEFNQTGKNRYKLLRKKKRNESIANVAFWIIFVCTIIAAADVIYNRFIKDETTHATPALQNKQQVQKENNPSQTSLHDTTKVLK
jgi:hypothetical protein